MTNQEPRPSSECQSAEAVHGMERTESVEQSPFLRNAWSGNYIETLQYVPEKDTIKQTS